MTSNGVEEALERARDALGSLPDAERGDAEALLSLWSGHLASPEEPNPDLKRDVGRLVEVLARRSAAAMPYAALGRALLARVSGSPRMSQDLLGEFLSKLAVRGF